VQDTIRVKGEAPRPVRLEFSHHGPLVSSDSSRGRAFALRFVGSEPGTAGYLAQLSLNRAQDWAGFQEAAARWKLPTENLVYADVDGNIGWIAAGLMPLRSWSGLLPVPGNGRYEWQGFMPSRELPSAFNPASGFIATANHNILPPGYSKPINYDWADPSRYQRIAAVLGDSSGFTRADFERLQHDELSLPAQAMVPVLLAALERHSGALQAPAADSAARLLGAWDFVMRGEAAAPLIYAVWARSLRPRLLQRWLGRAADTPGISLGTRRLVGLVTQPDWLPGPRPAAARDSIVVAAFLESVAELGRSPGGTPGTWSWGAVHRASFRHPLAAAFDLPSVARGGDGTTVNATGGGNLRQTSGASYRIVVDFADFDNSTATSVPGQSGQPGSEYYANLLPLWAEGKYFPLVYSRAAVERETSHILWLKP
jgi:penicillin amidase